MADARTLAADIIKATQQHT